MYNIDDIQLIPARITEIEHRSECNTFNADGKLPLFTAPMNSVIDADNYMDFEECKINTIIPRGVTYDIRLKLCTKTFVAMSLTEFSMFINEYNIENEICYVCIDVANGHMKKLIDLCITAKNKFGNNIVLMTGNIANPETYIDYAIAGIDFVRCGIGGSKVCRTTKYTGVGYGMVSLIKEIADRKYIIEKCINDASTLNIPCKYKSVPFIVADGGFDDIDKVIKALALGADFVMCGRLFAQCEEACGETYWQYPQDIINLSTEDKQRLVYHEPACAYGFHLRDYYGMSTHRAQKETGRATLAAEEGIETYVDIKYTLEYWCTLFTSYLQSAMSYANAKTLEEFKNTLYKIIN